MTTKQTTRRDRVNPIGEVTASNPVETHVLVSEPDAQSISTDRDDANGYSSDQRLDECPLPRAHRNHQTCTVVGIAECLVNCSPAKHFQSLGGDHDGK